MPSVRKRQAPPTQAVQPVLQAPTPAPAPVDDGCNGLIVSMHPVWPDMQFTQGELFFECTLFLYSVLALFLQYLNIYKTLWWLPKSYWHWSMKFHLINPYFLSCVGLLLGWRVTKCFWKTITELVNSFSANKATWMQSTFTIVEYAVVKTPLITLIITSFAFSFSRICYDFPGTSIIYFFYPLMVYCLIFNKELWALVRKLAGAISSWLQGKISMAQVFEKLAEPPSAQLDLESVLHMCSTNPAQIRQEVALLVDDLMLRLKRSLYAGASTAFHSILLPLVFVPYKTSLGVPQQVLTDFFWAFQLFVVVMLTAFSLYVTYLLPLNYLDLLHRAAVHLGRWDVIEGPKIGQTGQANWLPSPWLSNVLYNKGDSVQLVDVDGKCYKCESSSTIKTVAADPTSFDQRLFFIMCSNPCTLINVMCAFEGFLIIFQFWMLVLTTDWQHIVTLVLLMFANYLLLAKLFKDKVILGRIYDPSKEDLELIQQLQNENRSAAIGMTVN